MNPLGRFGLAHAEQASMEQMNGMLLEVDQNKQETIFRCREQAVGRGRRASRLAAPSMQRPYGHVVQERGLTGRHQGRKLGHGQARQISSLGSMGGNITVT